jgi:SAM-dependent methyltransferase
MQRPAPLRWLREVYPANLGPLVLLQHVASSFQPHTMMMSGLDEKNRRFYDTLWSKTYLTSPKRFNTWPLVCALLPPDGLRLEVGAGMRPRLPIAGTHFIDASPPAVARLNAGGGIAQCGQITELPFADGMFDFVAAFDVIEHVEDGGRAFSELCRVLGPDGRLAFSVPLHPAHWTEFDDYVGHARRYVPADLMGLIEANGLSVEKSCVFGMQSNSPRLLRFTVKGLTEHQSMAIRMYNWLFLPLGMVLQRPLRFSDGLIDLAGVHEALLVCRRKTSAGNSG